MKFLCNSDSSRRIIETNLRLPSAAPHAERADCVCEWRGG